ncbi:bile acid acyltransferase/acyl-CoA thioester hydrolase-like protein [Flavobacterium sp. 9]|uniref:acyl-CoA thioester hydrolase/BAAT C-terminal domain-containing protein n=1 Tax=Flavobacterium sp. 9 TaxID=2035198 RepID=UPI000C182093|nr:acyl-CoA thioester hydrolase/BAAT C-terminal domain-containing protein [Flavobacterium sp. 9]PIF32036.1 bile acid acyltransferase/acyl-CoA thioester hydrolase-like protein [Flavobacterium sp. 9]
MKITKTGILFLISFFYCLIVNAQNEDNFHIKKAGFTKTILKTKNDTIVFLTSVSKYSNAKPTIIFAQGSKPLPLIFYDHKSANSIIPFSIKEYSDKFNFVIIARKGIPLTGTYERDSEGYKNDKGKVPNEYTFNDNLYYRVNQVKVVLNYLCKNASVKKDSIFVIGHSEGYRVISKLAENNKKITKLVCMSADPFNRISASIIEERIKSFSNRKDNSNQLEINELIGDYKNIPLTRIKYKEKIEFNNWLSYNENLSYESLRKFKNPILIVYGTDDIGSIHNDLTPFLLPKSNINLKAYPNYGHNFEKKEFDVEGIPLEDSYHWDEVFQDVVKWLISK